MSNVLYIKRREGVILIYTDNKDFYPTPKALFNRLLGDNIRWLGGKILEPSAGKGDMIRYIKERMGMRENYNIDAIENDERLVSHLIGEGISVVWDDFLTYETFKEYDYIIMNPPFSNGVKHVLKAIELAENQITDCRIFATYADSTSHGYRARASRRQTSRQGAGWRKSLAILAKLNYYRRRQNDAIHTTAITRRHNGVI